MTLVNVRTNEVLEVQFNPSEFSKAIGANYARQPVPGLSYEPLQFAHTRNIVYEMELFYETANVGYDRAAKILSAIRYLDSMTYPRNTGGLRTGGPPRALFIWPGFITMSCVITDIEYTFNRFNLVNTPCAFLADVTLESISDVHLTSDVVRVIGDLRSNVIGV
jgi:hypothetical protein